MDEVHIVFLYVDEEWMNKMQYSKMMNPQTGILGPGIVFPTGTNS
jgi:hypothetical protein